MGLPASLERLVRLVMRELPARDAGVTSPIESEPEGVRLVSVPLPRGWRLWAAIEDDMQEGTARAKLATLAESFEGLVDQALQHVHVHHSPGSELRKTLRSLAESAGAHDAVVLDTHSPVVWGSASGMHGEALAPHLVVVQEVEHLPSEALHGMRHKLSRAAISEVRSLPEIATLARGGHLRRAEADDEMGWVVRSFASIYLLVVVFHGTFDEVRAEREIVRVLPAVEKLVLALPPPPMDTGAAAGMRKRNK